MKKNIKEKLKKESMNIDAVKEEILSRTTSFTLHKIKTRWPSNKYKGLSPFSSEKTPSFYTSPDKGVYYCFSTHQGGIYLRLYRKWKVWIL